MICTFSSNSVQVDTSAFGPDSVFENRLSLRHITNPDVIKTIQKLLVLFLNRIARIANKNVYLIYVYSAKRATVSTKARFLTNF